MKRGCPKTSIAASSTKRKKTSKNESKGSKSGLVRQHPEESTSPNPKRLKLRGCLVLTEQNQSGTFSL